MKILVLGGGGMIGHKLVNALTRDGLADRRDVSIRSADLGFPEKISGVDHRKVNIADAGVVERLAQDRPDVIFHLASIVSGEAETNFDLGWQVNLQPTLRLLEALRAEHVVSNGAYRPRIVFSSSIAVFGAPFPDKISDEFFATPLTSYGAQKLMCETLVTDYSRKGFVDGISIRLPTICVRPGKANKAASSFFSGIIREPLNGQKAVLPVPDSTRHWFASPNSAVGFLKHAATMSLGGLGDRRALNMPGLSCTVAEQIEALRAFSGNDAVALISPEPDAQVLKIVENWPRDFDAVRGAELGFRAETDFSQIIETYATEELD